MDRYRGREIRLLDVWKPDDWRMKVYGIGARGGMPSSGLMQRAKKTAARLLETVASHTDHYGVGFLGVHRGRGADVVFVDWWASENELHHHLHVAEPGRPETLRPRDAHELSACVWDLEVVAFERDAWVRCVLEHPDSPRWDEYMATSLEHGGAT